MRAVIAALIITSCVEGLAESAPPTPELYLNKISERFIPAKPTVVMSYTVHYRFLALNLLQVAEATIEATEGFWRSPDSDQATACCLISVTLQSPSAAGGAERGGRVYINSRIVSVVTMPQLDTLYYLKMTDELLNPVVGTKKDTHNFHVYDLSNGELSFFGHNYLDGTSATNITGATDMAAQGKEVSRVLTLLSDVYHERCGPISPDSDFRIFVNCDSKAVPFAARSARDNIHAFGGKYAALRVDVMPAREAPRGVRTRSFTVWTTSFMDVADRTKNKELRQIAAETPAWGMTPLLADYGMAVGQIRCSLKDISTRKQDAVVKRKAGHEPIVAPIALLAQPPEQEVR
jgi:hypothetical protein